MELTLSQPHYILRCICLHVEQPNILGGYSKKEINYIKNKVKIYLDINLVDSNHRSNYISYVF